MKYTRSGEYKLPGRIYRRAGNLALRMVPWVPSRVRDQFIRSRSYYQVFGDTEVGNHQGLSIRKWEAMHMPSDLTGKSVVDIGCSEGFFSQECAKRGAAPVLGVDSSLGRLLYASFTALNGGLNIRYRMGVFPDLGIRGTFDYVLCLSVLHHSLSKKDVWKVLLMEEFADDLAVLRKQLRRLRSLTTAKGTCILEIPYEYDDPAAERKTVDFQILNAELKTAGFASARCLGAWDYNPEHRVFKDRIIYVAEA
jgi:SAM-dependent methyltransferase